MRQTRRLGLVVLSAFAAAPLAAATFTVTTTNDSGPGSLRQAMIDGLANPGSDQISFDIPGAGPHTITPVTPLPTIADPLTIDGYTQPGSSPNTNGPGLPDNAVILIELDGSIAPLGTSALYVTGGGSGSDFHGLVLNRFPSDNNGNGGHGIVLEGASDCTIAGNFIGTNAAGTAASSNGGAGLFIYFGSPDNSIGGTAPASRNVISGNLHGGVIFGNNGTTGNLVHGNFIGIDAAGTVSIGNAPSGVMVNVFGTGNNAVGGMTPEERNVISGNSGYGVHLQNGSSGNVVLGNFIGTDVAGVSPAPNALAGVFISDGFSGAASNNLIGDGAGGGNLIAFNNGPGVSIASFLGNDNLGIVVSGNSIFENAGPGIDLNADGETPNDPGDSDAGNNALQNFPVISSAVPLGPAARQGGAGTQIQGALHSTPSTEFTLEFFSNPACVPFPHEFLEGRTFLGSTMVTTDGAGTASFDTVVPVTIEPGEHVTSTATDPAGNTSEFSQRLPFSMSPESGPAAGGTGITIAGTDFEAGATVTIGGVAATDVVVTSFNEITATTPALPAGSLSDVTVTNPEGTRGTLEKAWVSEFLDVPPAHQFYSFVSTLVSNAITAGVGGGLYGVDLPTLRQQIAVFLLKAKFGICYTPPACTPGFFADVPCPSAFAPWIEALANLGVAGGCGGGNYCPGNPVRRDQMAAFLLKAEHGSAYVPPPCSGDFDDVACPSLFADWIEQLADEQITGGCGGSNYCPLANSTRGQMAVFVVKTFDLQ